MPTKKARGRAQRTRDELHQALLSLVVERGYRKITVQDIIARARVGRTTFYAHFADKYDLLMSGMEALRTQLLSHARASTQSNDEALAFVRDFFRQGEIYLEPYRSLSPALRADAQRRLTAMLVEATRLELKSRSRFKRPRETDAFAHAVAGTVMGLVQWWIEQDSPVAAADLYATFQRLVAPGFDDIVSERFAAKCSARSLESVV